MKLSTPPFPADPGTYALLIRLDSPATVEVGRLGTIDFHPGWYAYVGSALGGLSARVGRHLRRNKKLHWHVDYLLEMTREPRVTWGLSDERMECRIGNALRRLGLPSVPRFGASDCKCPSHLFHSPTLESLRHEVARVFSSVGLTPNQYNPCTPSIRK